MVKTRVYLKDWFFNAGIVGFINILKENDDDFTEKHENYIEFDLENLKNFHKYYFKYFFDTYNVANVLNERIDKSFERISNYISNIDDKENKKKLKDEKKYLTDVIIKKELDEIKEKNIQETTKILENCNKISKINNPSQLLELKQLTNSIKKQLLKETINKELTLSKFRKVLRNQYFGQPNFLNNNYAKATFEEQQDIMYKGYISNIIETIFLQGILEDKYNIEELSNILAKKVQEKNINDDVKQIYSNIIKKYIQKGKNIQDIIQYIKNDIMETCSMCENESILTTNYSESNFAPLAFSSKNARNFFWNGNIEFPICDLCKLILFCIPAGISNIEKTFKKFNQNIGKYEYKSKTVLSFINYDTDISTLYKTNMNFKGNSIKNKENNPYAELILDIVSQEQKMSKWQLENIFVIEIDSVCSHDTNYSRMEYFNIKRYVAEFLTQYAKNSLNIISDYRLKVQIVDYMMKNKDIRRITNDRLVSELKEESRFSYNYYLSTIIQADLNILKKGGKNMNYAVDKANKKLFVMYRLGNEIYEQLQQEGNENKLDSYIYKMLNCIKSNRKNEFVDTAIRVIWSTGKDIPQILVQINDEVEWQELGHSFVSGLTRGKYVKEENING